MDYVEDLQFSGFKDGSIASTGTVEYEWEIRSGSTL